MKNRSTHGSIPVRYILTFLIGWLIFLQPTQALPQSSPDTLLDGYVSRALKVSPRVRALEEKMGALENRIPQTASLPDPRISFSFNNLPVNSFTFTQEPMTGKMVTLSQGFPFPGKLSTRGDVAREDARITGREIEDARKEIVRDVRSAYYDLLYLNEAIRIQEQSRDVLRGFSQTVRRKYEVGTGSQQDILKSDMEISRIADRILKLEEMRRATTDKLNALLLYPSGTGFVGDTLRPPDGEVFTDTLLIETAKQYRPLLLGLENAQAKARAQKHLADIAWFPDFTIGAGYTQRDYLKATGVNLVDFASISLSMNIPINYGGKRSAAGEEAESLERMYRAQYEGVLQQLQKAFGKSVAGLNTLRERLELLETGLLPQAAQAFNASLAGYQVGEVDYLTVLDNLVKLFQMETDVYRFRADYWSEIAEIEFLAGKGPNE